jgi:hypothetical protein
MFIICQPSFKRCDTAYDDTRQIVEKIPIFAIENSTKWDSSIMPPMKNGRPANSNTITLTQDCTKLNRGCNKGNWRQPPHRRRITSFEAWLTDCHEIRCLYFWRWRWWLWFLWKLVTKLYLVFTVPEVFLFAFPVEEFCISVLQK